MSTVTPTTIPAADWRKIHALGLPNGSIRALLALVVCAAIWAWLFFRPDDAVPSDLQNLLFIILGHYFAVRSRHDPMQEAGPPPLFMPSGTVRFLLVAGFVGVTVLLFYQNRVWSQDPRPLLSVNRSMVTLILVAGFLLGVVLNLFLTWWRHKGHRPSRVFEDTRALLALSAALLLVGLLFGSEWLSARENLQDVQRFLAKYKVQEVLAAVVGFYFGSRS